MAIRYSLHKIRNSTEFGFSDTEYSRFKFGDGIIAEKFGISLAEAFIKDELSQHYDGPQLVVISSPYSFVPTATFYLKSHFVFQINKWLAQNNYPVAQETKIHRYTSYSEDYGMLNAEERMRLIGNDTFHIDKIFIQDKLLVFIDDIKITGSHEKMITKMLADQNIKDRYHLLYFAELINQSIHPSIENSLNYAYVKSIFDLDDILNTNSFAINTRIVKYILNSQQQHFKLFIDQKSDYIKNLIFNMAIGNSYHLVDSYKSNFDYLQKALLTTHLTPVKNGY